MKCDKCDVKVDSRVAHLYLFYIMEGVDKVGVVFEYSSACVNQLGLGLSLRGPTVKAGSQSMTLQLLIKFMTVDHIQTVKDSHPDLKIKTDKSITRGILNRYRKIRGFYTQDSEMEDSRTLKKWLDNASLGAKRKDGVFLELTLCFIVLCDSPTYRRLKKSYLWTSDKCCYYGLVR